MANTKLKKKKKGVIGANGLNNDAGKIASWVCDILLFSHVCLQQYTPEGALGWNLFFLF